ncbi:hypothetical protein K9L16_00035 [Candidatus Pacearchaeota archaeon]|nr:hypothetical protein [Candidatus Pacearchaeota archaeon]
MGLIRSGLVFLVSFLLFMSFFIGGLLLTITFSLDYDVLSLEISSISEDILDEVNFDEIIGQNLEPLKLYCKNNSEFVFNYEGQVFNVDCNKFISNIEQPEEFFVQEIFRNIYYKEYSCEFWNCLEETGQPLFFISKFSHDYFYSKFLLTLFIAVILFVALFLLSENKSSSFIISGILLAIASLPFMKLEWFVGAVLPGSFLQFLELFFMKAHSVFIWWFTLGILLFVIGILFKFFNIGMEISKLFANLSSKKNKTASNTETTNN